MAGQREVDFFKPAVLHDRHVVVPQQNPSFLIAMADQREMDFFKGWGWGVGGDAAGRTCIGPTAESLPLLIDTAGQREVDFFKCCMTL